MNWSQGGTATQTLVVPEHAQDYTATYQPGSVPAEGGYRLVEDFECTDPGTSPVDWFDTGAGNSLLEVDNFDVTGVAGTTALTTTSTDVNIHSHYVGPGADGWSDYEYTGRLRLGNLGGGIGVTFLSAYPNADRYYRLRRHGQIGSTAFHIYPHGTSITGGATDSGVEPAADTWYRFRIQVTDTGVQTEIRARVWPDGSAEPDTWQIDCHDAGANRLTNGTVGVWSMATGAKHWDDVTVMVACTVPGDFDCDGDIDLGDYDLFEMCASGPAVPVMPGCEDRDFDGDGDADHADFTRLHQCVTGPDTPADPACIN